MVQRKVPSKLCIQKTDHLNPETGNGKVRPPSPRFQDGKNKGTEMKKKMKRSKSINPSTIQRCLKTPSFMKQVPQPGKPPTDEKEKEKEKEKKKQSTNNMKPTSSFEAKKEQSQVNSLKSPKKDLKSSKLGSNSTQLSAKMLTRTSSLKKVRTLTKTPSFKPSRVAKKCPRVVLCEDLDSQRATCSSTLKDSKFPNYLELSRGATESEGTSLTKVCPYTYCSLNGHRHAHLPPLKSFLLAKRHMLKTQKSIKLGCLSPRRTKPSGDLKREISREIAVEEKATIHEPRVEEDHMDFYIEIYVENREGDPKINFGSNGDVDVDGISNEDQEEETTETVSNQSDMELNGTDSETYNMECEEGRHPAEDRDEIVSETSSLVSGNNPSFHSENTFSISCFDKIMNLPQQEEIFEDYESTKNNTQVFNIDICHKEECVDDFLAHTENAATEKSPEQATEKEKQSNANESLTKVHAILSVIDGASNEFFDDKCRNAEQTNTDAMEISYSDNSDHNETPKQAKTAYTRGSVRSSEDLQSNTINLQITKRGKSENELAKERDFNPREPNYLPITPDPEAEKVDLRHQDLDDRKNAEEWMIDYALQQTVTKLAPARKRKVALLVEAFEKVIPPHFTSSVFAPVRPIQACN